MSDKRNEDLKQFIIPENFMGESRLFQGQLKTRNVVEGGLISGVLAIFFWNVISVPITTKISLVKSFVPFADAIHHRFCIFVQRANQCEP